MRTLALAFALATASIAMGCNKSATEALAVPVPGAQEELKPTKISVTEITSATLDPSPEQKAAKAETEAKVQKAVDEE